MWCHERSIDWGWDAMIDRVEWESVDHGHRGHPGTGWTTSCLLVVGCFVLGCCVGPVFNSQLSIIKVRHLLQSTIYWDYWQQIELCMWQGFTGVLLDIPFEISVSSKGCRDAVVSGMRTSSWGDWLGLIAAASGLVLHGRFCTNKTISKVFALILLELDGHLLEAILNLAQVSLDVLHRSCDQYSVLVGLCISWRRILGRIASLETQERVLRALS